MIKKLFYTGCAAALLLTTACSSEDIVPAAEQESLVSFNVELPAEINSRAYSDGLTARKLIVAVYDASGTELTALRQDDLTFDAGTLTKPVTMRLANSRTYKVVFWVQAATAPYTFDTTNHKVDVDYDATTHSTPIAANSDLYDAFFKCEDVDVNGSITRTVELRRPFAQINIGATDYAAAAAAGWETDKTSVHVDNVYSTLNLFDGTVSGLVSGGYTYTLAAKPVVATDGRFPATGVDAEYQSMVYVLTRDEQSLTDVEFKAQDGAEVITRTYANVPVRRNYRTNIYGNILTEEANFTVQIVPTFKAPDNNVEVVEASTEADIVAAIAAGAEVVQVNNDIQLTAPLTINSDIRIVGAGVGASGARSRAAAGEVIITGEPIYINTANAYFEGVTFKNGTTGNQSALYATSNTARNVTFVNCTFTNAKWDALQLTDRDIETVTFRNCYFHNTEAGYRYIHLELRNEINKYTSNPNAKVEISDCVFENVSSSYCSDSAITIAGFALSNLDLRNNVIKGEGEVNTTTFWICDLTSFSTLLSGDALATAFAKYVANGVSQINADTYAIYNKAGLYWFAQQVNNSGIHYAFRDKTVLLTADIDLEDELWTPIGQTGAGQFEGVFNGQGHTIYNLNIQRGDFTNGLPATGLFGWLNSGIVKNLTIDGATVVGNEFVGTVVGYIENHTEGRGVVDNCTVKNATVSGIYKGLGGICEGDKVGGAVGFINGNCAVTNCTVINTNVDAVRDAGQVLGCRISGGKVEGNTATNVTVTHNTTAPTGYEDDGENITNGIIGREA